MRPLYVCVCVCMCVCVQIATLEADLEATQRLATQYKSRAAAASQEVAALEESLLSERATVNRLRRQLQDARDESVRSVAGDVYTPGGAGAAPATNARLARRLAEEEVEEAKVHLKRLQKQVRYFISQVTRSCHTAGCMTSFLIVQIALTGLSVCACLGMCCCVCRLKHKRQRTPSLSKSEEP